MLRFYRDVSVSPYGISRRNAQRPERLAGTFGNQRAVPIEVILQCFVVRRKRSLYLQDATRLFANCLRYPQEWVYSKQVDLIGRKQLHFEAAFPRPDRFRAPPPLECLGCNRRHPPPNESTSPDKGGRFVNLLGVPSPSAFRR